MRFIEWLEEAKKKSDKESIPTTVMSSPLRGQNQDYNGVGVSHAVADYTISDDTKAKKQVKEIVSGVGTMRQTPVNMRSAPHSKSSNAPASAGRMQRAADSRRIDLDTQAQKQREMLQKRRVSLITQRTKKLKASEKKVQ